MLKAFV